MITRGDFEGLYYVDNDYFIAYAKKDDPENVKPRRHIPINEWDECEEDEEMSSVYYDHFITLFCEDIRARFQSFKPKSKCVRKDGKFLILENELFYIGLEDNGWSIAVELLQKEHECYNLTGLQAALYQKYLNGIKDCLFNQFDELRVYSGPWTSGTIKKNN